MICKRYDPITASCAPCCDVCSHYQRDCSGQKEAAPVRQHRNGNAERDLQPLFSASYDTRH